jgi:hypothetical protein
VCDDLWGVPALVLHFTRDPGVSEVVRLSLIEIVAELRGAAAKNSCTRKINQVMKRHRAALTGLVGGHRWALHFPLKILTSNGILFHGPVVVLGETFKERPIVFFLDGLGGSARSLTCARKVDPDRILGGHSLVQVDELATDRFRDKPYRRLICMWVLCDQILNCALNVALPVDVDWKDSLQKSLCLDGDLPVDLVLPCNLFGRGVDISTHGVALVLVRRWQVRKSRDPKTLSPPAVT